jgi:hypothetical protein
MRLRVLILSAAAVFAVSGGAAPSVATVPVPNEVESCVKRSIFEGDWESVFGTSRLIFRFQPENGVLMGWFVSTKNGQSYPLKDVRVKGRTLSFVYTSKPELTYKVTAQKGNQVLSGIWSSPDGAALPVTLVRKQSQ